MRVSVRSGKHRFRLWLPSCMIFSSLSASVVGKYVRFSDTEIKLTEEQCRRLFREIRRLRKQLPDWNLVEIASASGESITVRL